MPEPSEAFERTGEPYGVWRLWIGVDVERTEDVRSSSRLSWEHQDGEVEMEDALLRLSSWDFVFGILRSRRTGGGLRESSSDFV